MCLKINSLLEIERTWARLHTLGMLRKVGPLPQILVQPAEAPIDLGEHFMLHIRIFWLFQFLTASSCSFAYIRGFGANVRPPLSLTSQARPSRPSPFTLPACPQQQVAARPSRPRERPAAGDKRKWPTEEPALENIDVRCVEYNFTPQVYGSHK